MRFNIFLRGTAAATAAGGVSAHDSPHATRAAPLLVERQATITATRPTSTLMPDPWQCVTENITQYFDVPTPTGTLFDAIDSYGFDVAAPCRATATGRDLMSCTVSDPKSWCGFTTAAPADVLSDYSATYLSDVVSFWTAKSETISILSTSCPVAWNRFAPIEHEWLKIAAAHANCYLEAHPQTQTVTTAPTSAADETNAPTPTTTTTSDAGVLRRGQAVEAIALISAGLAVLANAA